MSTTGDWSETPVCTSSGQSLDRNLFWLLPSWVAIIQHVEDAELASLLKLLVSVFLVTKFKKTTNVSSSNAYCFFCVCVFRIKMCVTLVQKKKKYKIKFHCIKVHLKS